MEAQILERIAALRQRSMRMRLQKRYERAISLAREALDLAQEYGGPEHAEVAIGLRFLSDQLAASGDREGAQELLRASRCNQTPRVIADGRIPDVERLIEKAERHRRTGDYAVAIPLMERAIVLCLRASTLSSRASIRKGNDACIDTGGRRSAFGGVGSLPCGGSEAGAGDGWCSASG